jgi:hypothetical protein
MHCIVVSAIFEFFFDTLAYFKMAILGNSDVTRIEKFMNIGSKKNAIIDAMGTAFPEWLDVYCIQRG